jgi:RNase P subunit RPR2
MKQCEDFLFPKLKMTVRERSLYYHLLRHTRLIDKEVGLFALVPLATALNIAESSVREDVRNLHERGCIKIEDRSRIGHQIRVLLPGEIDGVVPREQLEPEIDIESVDFFSDRRYLSALIARENGTCFYCLRLVRPDNCELDHVIARANRTDNSYRNIVVSCHECNTTKQARDGEDFVRVLYRRGILSQPELEQRLVALERLRSGKLIPDIGQSEGAEQGRAGDRQ